MLVFKSLAQRSMMIKCLLLIIIIYIYILPTNYMYLLYTLTILLLNVTRFLVTLQKTRLKANQMTLLTEVLKGVLFTGRKSADKHTFRKMLFGWRS